MGYIQQAFTRAAVRESLQHGVENAPYLQRSDLKRTRAGIATTHGKNIEPNATHVVTKSIHTLCDEMDS